MEFRRLEEKEHDTITQTERARPRPHPLEDVSPRYSPASGRGLRALALEWLLARDAHASTRANPLATKPPHFSPKAKSVIFLYMAGGPSSIDLFDPKPALAKYES